MGLETGTFVDDLVTSNPDGATDDIKKGDDHLRLMKSVLKATFPNATKAFRFESVLTKTTTYPVVAADARALILGDASSGAFTITLPLGSTVFAGYTVLVMKSESSSNDVTVDGNGAETVNGTATRSLTAQYQGEKYTWDGSEWKVIALTHVGTSNLIDGSVTVAKLAASAVETAKINNLAVTTAKIAANAVDGTKIALGSDAQGDVMYYDGTDWVALAPGTADKFLQTKGAGADPVWANPGLTRFADVATTSGTAHGFTSIAAGTNLIIFMLDEVSVDGTDTLELQIGDAGGYETSAYTSNSTDLAGNSLSTSGYLLHRLGAPATHNWSGMLILSRFDGNTWSAIGSLANQVGTFQSFASGRKILSAELDRIQIVPSGSDVFDNGKISLITQI